MNVTSFGKSIFANVIKDLEIRSLRIIWEALNPVTSDLIRETQRDTQKKRRQCDRGTGIDDWSHKSKKSQQLPETRRSKEQNFP